MDENLNQRLAEIARIAVRLETETGVPARLLIAQWAVESKWGSKPVGHLNVFGIKRAARHTQFCEVLTREVVAGEVRHLRLEFADYGSLEDACRDYAWLISHGDPYRASWQRHREDGDFAALIDGVAKVYATDPGYAALLKRIASQANISAAIGAARAERPA